MKRREIKGIVGIAIAILLMAAALPNVVAQENPVKTTDKEPVEYAKEIEQLLYDSKKTAEEIRYVLKKENFSKDELESKLKRMVSDISKTVPLYEMLQEKGVDITSGIEKSYESFNQDRNTVQSAISDRKNRRVNQSEMETDEDKLEEINDDIDYLELVELQVPQKLESRVEELEKLNPLDNHGAEDNSQKMADSVKKELEKLEKEVSKKGFKFEPGEREGILQGHDDAIKKIQEGKFDDSKKSSSDTKKRINSVKNRMRQQDQLFKKQNNLLQKTPKIKATIEQVGSNNLKVKVEIKNLFTRSTDLNSIAQEVLVRLKNKESIKFNFQRQIENDNLDTRFEGKIQSDKGLSRVEFEHRFGIRGMDMKNHQVVTDRIMAIINGLSVNEVVDALQRGDIRIREPGDIRREDRRRDGVTPTRTVTPTGTRTVMPTATETPYPDYTVNHRSGRGED